MKKKILKFRIIYYFYKLLKIYRNKKPATHYGEFGEDILVNRIFKNKNYGTYVDIGAYHPFKGSLTQKLYSKGWKGINIDLSKTSIDLFDIARPNDLNINCAIGIKNEETSFFQNSLINQQNSLKRQNPNQKEIKIKCFRLDDLLISKKIKNVDYINIDTEGTELDVIKGIDLEKTKPLLLTIEDNNFDNKADSKIEKIYYMKNLGYELINTVGVTMFFFRNEMISKLSELIKI